ncbi:MAG: cobalamin-dependent protein [Deltaproteobacteria bacterium]|nr:cobalamin-dependent protein [Deltaproteobacteria bacterium]
MSEEILEKLRNAILTFDNKGAAAFSQEAIDAQIDPMIVMDALIKAVQIVGDAFGAGKMFLPELVGAADALQAATPIVEAEIEKKGHKRESLGTIVIGTVAGDMHTIGKSMVTSLLAAEGFEVHDIGINVPSEKFIEAVKEHQPEILGMSALLSTTAPECKHVIDQLNGVGLRDGVKVMVGGGAMTAEFAKGIGADGYEPTAPAAVKLAHRLLQR